MEMDGERAAPAEPGAQRVAALEHELKEVRCALRAALTEQERLQAKVHAMAEIERALRVSEEQFRTLASCLPVGVFQTNAVGDCTYVNARWQQRVPSPPH